MDELPIPLLVLAALVAVCAAGLVVLVLSAPRRDCWFLRWAPEVRFLLILASPALVVMWPIVLVAWLMQAGVIPSDRTFYD
jgi:hypothetical protein